MKLNFGVRLSLLASGSLVALLTLQCGGGGHVSSGSGGATSLSNTGGLAGSGGSSAGSGGAISVTQGTGGNPIGGIGGHGGMSTGGSGGTSSALQFDVEPAADQVLTVMAGQPVPTVTYMATYHGQPVNVGWSVDRGDIGKVPTTQATSAVFTPSGQVFGVVHVIAGLNGQMLSRNITVKYVGSQSGPSTNMAQQALVVTDPSKLPVGGGIGGVGGEGLGVAPPASAMGMLNAPTDSGASQHLKYLYPYDKTVWPRGMLAPLVMWSWDPQAADAIRLHLQNTSGTFTWDGYFAAPSVLTSAGLSFVRHPIPPDIWQMATDSSGEALASSMSGTDDLTLSLTVMKGGVAHGPISETWKVAPGRLTGTVYYNSYGTQLVHNNMTMYGPFGAAVLGIKPGATAPVVVSGHDSSDASGCRVCHEVSANGNRLWVQDGDSSSNYSLTSQVDLTTSPPTEIMLPGQAPNMATPPVFSYATLSSDGSRAINNASVVNDANESSHLYSVDAMGNHPQLPDMGIPSDLQMSGPGFSADDSMVAFEYLAGSIMDPGGHAIMPGSLMVMDYNRMTGAFSNLRYLAQAQGTTRQGFPSFFPTNDAVAYHYQTAGDCFSLRYSTCQNPGHPGAQAQVWMATLMGQASVLPALNGLESDGMTPYIPLGPNNHGLDSMGNPTGTNDTVLNYEPNVVPITSGGYIWVVFTSRRLYGNLAVSDPYQSQPGSYDFTKYANLTTKKLWVAAIDLSSTPGKDRSHPAFYLPGQEITAGNSRGFWVLDPCKANGGSCQSGDQCCGGFCEPNASGALVCGQNNPNASCAGVQEHCNMASDCCDSTNQCINHFCSIPAPGVN